MKTAVVHDWFTTYAGSERVVEEILALYPDADLYSLFDFIEENDRHRIKRTAGTSLLQHAPFARTRYRSYLPLMPYAIERFDLSTYDLILSSSHAVAKGVRKRPDQMHICYCHTPMRYAWDLREQYLKEAGLDRGPKGILAKLLLNRLQQWDAATAARVDHFIANSRYIAKRIRQAYQREATVIYPPVDTDRFTCTTEKEDFFLSASRMVPYKKMDLIVEAFSSMQDKHLIVLGGGPDLDKVRSRAGKNVTILGYQTSDVLQDLMQRAKAFVFAAEEDFGIIPVEAQACGTPVIAYGKGGVTETIVPLRHSSMESPNDRDINPTGVFFSEQTVGSLADAVQFFEVHRRVFDATAIRKHAVKFSKERFRREYKEFVEARLSTDRS